MPRSSCKRNPKPPNSSRPKSKPKPTPTQPEDIPTDGPIFFWKPHEVPYGVFSQWYESPFTAPLPDGSGSAVYNTAEQFMMHRKSLLFNDHAIASDIMATTDPRTQRALGRAVKNFDEATWTANRCAIVEEGSYWKFVEDPGVLLGTGERELVEASPRDRVWGIGRGAERAGVECREGGKGRGAWGLNLLGRALVVARGRIRGEGGGRKEVVAEGASEGGVSE